MGVRIRLTRTLYDEVRADLVRPHDFASERVGFLHARLGNSRSTEPIVFFTGYSPVPDDQYIHDRTVGARIDRHAIRNAMQTVLDRNEGVFHVHMHAFGGRLSFSGTDKEELPPIVRSFRNVGAKLPHGLFLMNDDNCMGEVWLPGGGPPAVAARVTLVGYPVSIFVGASQ